MTSERVFYSDANGIRIGTQQVVFGDQRYGTRSISSASVVTESRRSWPGMMVMVIGGILLVFGFLTDTTQPMVMGAGGFAGGSFYFGRHKPRYAIRLVTSNGDFLVVASRRKPFLEEIKAALDRAMSSRVV